MNTYLVTELVDIYDDGTSTDDYDDPIDNGTLTASGVAMSLLERTDVTHRSQDSQEDTTRIYAGIAPHDTQIEVGYRLQSQADGAYYLVDHVRRTNGSLQMPIRLRCRRIDQ